ncbi:MAG: cobaltochelatase subunit CobN, partial [Pseudomonadota bacterium]|nr:cobaltochelatase subunit CobN [Pseudomonadota bacterium]
MHLLAAQPGALSDNDEAIDLEQSPGDVVFLSAADTDLALITAAQEARLADAAHATDAVDASEAPSLRAANLMQLQHPMSVDLYLERVVRNARVVVVRLLGGKAYWSYGVEQLVAACQRSGAALALLPGDDRPDAELRGWSNLDAATYDGLWALLGQGGAVNARAFVDALGALASLNPGEAAPAVRAAEALPENGLLDPSLVPNPDAPVVPLVFYRALVQAGDLAPVQALAQALSARGLRPLPIFLKSLKDAGSRAFLAETFAEAPPSTIINFTAFSAAKPGQASDDSPFGVDAPVIQAVLSGGSLEAWREGTQGLGPRDLAMNVVLPEVDGRILSRAVSFKSAGDPSPATECAVVRHQPLADRVDWVAALAESWARLRALSPAERGVALVLANYPNKDSRIANGVGLDAPASTTGLLQALAGAGYDLGEAPAAPTSPEALMQLLLSGPTNRDPARDASTTIRLSEADYRAFFDQLPATVRTAVEARWGGPAQDPFWDGAGFHLALHRFGKVLIGIQPQRGYHLDIEGTYHDPDLVPPHGYLAFYAAVQAQAHAVIHVGKHGNLEWLPGKALALSEGCFPDAVLGPMPQLYPFIVNDPGEGSQAKRRTAAVVVDHLTPPLTRAGLHGDLSALEADVDEYFQAAGLHPARATLLAKDIVNKVHDFGLADDLGLSAEDGDAAVLGKLDGFLCDLKDLQIRDGLHIFGAAPQGPQRRDLLLALARPGFSDHPSYIDALAQAEGISAPLLSLDPGQALSVDGIDGRRTVADHIEALEQRAQAILDGHASAPTEAVATLFSAIETVIAPLIDASATRELSASLQGLDGRFVPPGPSGAPTRARLDVLPTGRNFFSVDTRAVPTQAAWRLGWKSASLLVERYAQDQGDWPRRMLLSCWGTANMRTGGEDIALALALLGVKPQWDTTSGRVTGFEVLPL